MGLQDKRVLLTVGRMDSRERYKGHDRVIAAIPQLVAAGHDVVYLVVGEGDDRASGSLRLRSWRRRPRAVHGRSRTAEADRGLPGSRRVCDAVNRGGIRDRFPGSYGERHAGAWSRRRRRPRRACRR